MKTTLKLYKELTETQRRVIDLQREAIENLTIALEIATANEERLMSLVREGME